MNGIMELLTNKYWMIMPDFVHGIRTELQHNLSMHAALNLPEKKMGYPVSVNGGRILADYGRYDKVNEPFVNLEIINGPITRNGDACSYGSRDHRDMMMMAADSPYCVGHIYLINTPGGSAWAKNDYQQGIEYAHSKGQKVIAFIDGLCASAGMYLASLCDERYYMNPNNEIGCIGVMAAFYTEADGSVNQFTNETYHELYDPQSFDKNREFRDVANDNNSEKMIAELAALGVEFRADVKKACPKAKEEHLHGKIFKASEVDGILMDGQKNLAEVMDIVIKTSKNPMLKQNGGDPMQQALAAGEETAKKVDNILSTTLNTINMKEKFPALFAALQVEEMQMSEEGAFLNMGLLETLNATIEAAQNEKADALALVESLTAEKENLTQQVADLNSQVETLNTEHTQAIEEKDNQISALTQEKADLQTKIDENAVNMESVQTELNGAKASLETAQNTIAERDQQISDLNAQIDEMKQEPNPDAGLAGPQNNGQGVEQPEVAISTKYVMDPSLSYEENMRLKKEWEESHK